MCPDLLALPHLVVVSFISSQFIRYEPKESMIPITNPYSRHKNSSPTAHFPFGITHPDILPEYIRLFPGVLPYDWSP